MGSRTLIAAAIFMSAPFAALGQTPFTSLHPEEAHPDPSPQTVQHAYTDLVVRMQERLNALGFDAGPPNGEFGAKTQAALAQFQISRAIPASGALDDPTLAELGLEREPLQASVGATASAQPDAPAEPQAPAPPANPDPAAEKPTDKP